LSKKHCQQKRQLTDQWLRSEVTVPSLDDWEKDWQDNPQRSVLPKLLPVDFQSPFSAVTQSI
jgi:hypothetical protein